MSDAFDGTLVTLLDEDGNEREFEHVDTLETDGETYVALIPTFDDPQSFVESDGELVILKVVEDENGEEILSTIDEEEEFDRVAGQFQTRLEDDFEILS